MRFSEHLEKLHYFTIAYEANSFKRAAETALVSQPQITRTIKLLEEILNKELFLRSSKGVTPTIDGEQLYIFAKKLFQQSDEFEFKMRSDSKKFSGTIRIGTYDSISRYFFPDFIRYMKNLMPKLTIVLSTGRSKNIISKLCQQQLDFAIVVGKPSQTYLESKCIYQDSFKFYKTKQLEKSSFNTVIAFEDSIKYFNTILPREFKHVFNCENLETVMSLTLEGLGLGLLPTKVAHDNVISGKLIEVNLNIKEKISEHQIYIITNKDKCQRKTQIIYHELIRFLEIWSKR